MPEVSAALPHEERAKNMLKDELDERGIAYAQLAEKLKLLGANKNERNLANKLSRGGFTAAFFMMCVDLIGSRQISLQT